MKVEIVEEPIEDFVVIALISFHAIVGTHLTLKRWWMFDPTLTLPRQNRFKIWVGFFFSSSIICTSGDFASQSKVSSTWWPFKRQRKIKHSYQDLQKEVTASEIEAFVN